MKAAITVIVGAKRPSTSLGDIIAVLRLAKIRSAWDTDLPGPSRNDRRASGKRG